MARHRPPRGARLEVVHAVHRVGPGRAGLGLAVGVHDRHAAVAEVRAGPVEGLGVQRLALHRHQPQRGQRVPRRLLVAHGAQHAQRGRRDQDLADPVARRDLVEPQRRGRVERALVAQDRAAVRQAADHRLDREGEPADVGRAPVHVLRLQPGLPLHVGPGADQEAGDAVHHALGPRLRAAGEDQEGRVVGLQRHARALGRLRTEQRRPAALPLAQRPPLAGAVHHHHVTQQRRPAPRRAQVLQQRHHAAAAQAHVGGDDAHRARGREPQRHRLGGEPGEQHGVDRADAVAGVDRDERLGQVGQVDRHHVAAPHAQRPQGVGAAPHLVAQRAVGEGAHRAVLALPDHRRLVAPRRVLGVTVHAVVGHVQRAADEVAQVRHAAGPHRVPGSRPAEPPRRPSPVLVDARRLGRARLGQQRRLPRGAPPRRQRLQRLVDQHGQGVAGAGHERCPPRITASWWRLGGLAGSVLCSREARKRFFFEKKKQKTFTH